MLLHPADRRPTAIVLTGLALALLPFALPLPAWALIPLWIASMVARTVAPVQQHNHAHLRVFKGRLANLAYDQCFALAAGYTTPGWELQHVLGHHRLYLKGAADPACNHRFSGPGPWQRPLFTLLGSALSFWDAARVARALKRDGKRDHLPRLLAHKAVALSALGGLLWLDPWLAFAFFLGPHLLLRWAVFWFSYRQHEGAPMTHVYDGAITNLGPFNGWLLNVGHHTAHHERPAMHWTLLPARTAQIRDRIPAVCVVGEPAVGSAPGDAVRDGAGAAQGVLVEAEAVVAAAEPRAAAAELR